jgi:hypothetical protein
MAGVSRLIQGLTLVGSGVGLIPIIGPEAQEVLELVIKICEMAEVRQGSPSATTNDCSLTCVIIRMSVRTPSGGSYWLSMLLSWLRSWSRY